MDETTKRFRRLVDLMNEMLLTMTPAQRDRMIQRHLAASMTPQQRFQLLCGMMNFTLGQLQRRRREADEQQPLR